MPVDALQLGYGSSSVKPLILYGEIIPDNQLICKGSDIFCKACATIRQGYYFSPW